MRALVTGDTIVVSKLDRLARSSRDLQSCMSFRSGRGESWCDSTSEVGRLMLTIMGGIAEFERGLIRKRREEGIQRANALLARLDALISEEADDPAALTHEARQKAEAEVMGDLLAVERDEAAASLLKLMQNVVQIPVRPRQAVQLAHHDGIAGHQRPRQLAELRAIRCRLA